VIGGNIVIVGVIVILFAAIIGQLAGRDIPDNVKTFIGGIVLLGLIIMAGGGITWALML